MFKYIILIVGFIIVYNYPILLLFGAAGFILWIMLSYDDDRIKEKSECPITPIPRQAPSRYSFPRENPKPSFQNDPEWKERSAAIRAEIERNRQSNSAETEDINPFKWAKSK